MHDRKGCWGSKKGLLNEAGKREFGFGRMPTEMHERIGDEFRMG